MIDAVYTPIDKWGLASIIAALGADDGHVWRASLDQPAGAIERLARLLSKDEYQRAERFHCSTDRRRFIAGRGILRKIISGYLALAPAEVRFVYNEYGKPLFDQYERGASVIENRILRSRESKSAE